MACLLSTKLGLRRANDGEVVVVRVVAERAELDDALRERIRRELKASASPRHAPAVILEVGDVPYTISGKKVELAVREIVHGRPVKNRDALKNPEALQHYRDRPELAG